MLQSASVTEAEIRSFLENEQLGYQKIDLPYGLSTPGHARGQAKRLAIPERLDGKSVLDVGSFLGAFCIEALQRGAQRAVGLELNRERLRQAEEIGRFLGLRPEYVRADIEDWPIDEPFDVTLCLNILHHLRDPIGTLRKLALKTRERLIVEAASLGDHDAAKHGLDATVWTRWLFGRRRSVGQLLSAFPVAYVGPYTPSKLTQSYFYTASALRRILDGHMRLFQKIEEFPSEFKGRYLLRCTRLNIEHLVVVAGACAAGKSTLCENIADHARMLGISDPSASKEVSPMALWSSPTERHFPDARCPLALFHYDLGVVERFNLHHPSRDPATDLLRSAGRIDVILVAPRRETLKRQLLQSEGQNGELRKAHHRNYMKLYDHPTWLRDLYTDWISFCGSIVPQARFFVYQETDSGRELRATGSSTEAASLLNAVY